jgi:D-alanine-D-alanine ligase
VGELCEALERAHPELVFNLLEEFGGKESGNIGVCALLDLLNLPYTGSGPGESYLMQDKALAKRMLAFDNIAYPKFALFSQDQGLETGGNLRMPLFVKPAALDGSLGIGEKSLVHSAKELMERVLAVHNECKDDALAEEFIEGREFYVGVLGNAEPIALPVIEADFSGLPKGAPKIYDRKAKWEPGSPEYRGTSTKIAELEPELAARLQKVATDAYRALRVRDYGRVDLRLSESGEIYVLEVNANCYLEKSDEFATAAAAAGISYLDLVRRIVELAVKRYEARS